MFSEQIELDELLPLIMEKTKEALHAENCSLLLLDENRQQLFFPVISDIDPEVGEHLREVTFPADRGIAGWVVQHGKSTLVPDVARDERWYPDVDKRTGVRTRDLLYAPLRTRYGVIGVISLRNKREGVFDIEDLNFLDALVGPVAIAIENARLYLQVKQSEAKLKQEVATLSRERVRQDRFPEIVGNGPAATHLFAKMESVIGPSFPVLIEGETGTGKELIAKAIHYSGPRKEQRFVPVNCGAIPEDLVESELFGHKKGSFSGATVDKPGLFEVADGGTIFLDEIGETPLHIQIKLLRVLQEGKIRRLGETNERTIDVRVISATNKNLTEEVQQHRFREDLYYRINVFPIEVPPLRERREDIPLLVSHFMRKCSVKQVKRVEEIEKKALELLTQYSWPGNIRELENEVERAVALTPDGQPIAAEQLSDRLLNQKSLRVPFPSDDLLLEDARNAFEKAYIEEMLSKYLGNAKKTAEQLGITRQHLHNLIRKYGLRTRERM
jgi:Nif-specific regulatory protein